MRNLVIVLAAGMLVFCVSGQRAAQAASGSDTLPTVDFRAASTTAVPGFKVMESPEGRYFVGPQVLFKSADVLSAQLQRAGTALELALTPRAAAELTELGQSARGDRLAILVHGSLVGAPTVRMQASESVVFLVGLSVPAAEHLVNLLSRVDVGAGAATISVLPAQDAFQPGDVLTVDVFISGAPDLRVYQVQLAATGSSTGRLPLEDMWVDTARADFAFGSAQVIEATDASRSRFGALRFVGSEDIGEAKYIGSASFRTPAGVSDTYLVNVLPNSESFLRDGVGEPMALQTGGVLITVGAPTSLRHAAPSRTK